MLYFAHLRIARTCHASTLAGAFDQTANVQALTCGFIYSPTTGDASFTWSRACSTLTMERRVKSLRAFRLSGRLAFFWCQRPSARVSVRPNQWALHSIII